jgi:CubicO group peptidase (beta-lactamase class C family)
MTHTFYNMSPYYLAKDRSNSYEIVPDMQGQQTVRAFGREFDTGITTPNGGLNAPMEDMEKWISFLAGTSPASRSDLILNRKSLQEMWHPVVAIDGQTYAPPASMGLSFFLFQRGSGNDAVTLVGHTGHQAGFAAFFVVNPRTGRAVIAVVNTVHAEEDTPIAKKEYDESKKRFSALMEQAIGTIR